MLCPRCARSIPDDAALCCYCGRNIVIPRPSKVHQRPNGSGTAFKTKSGWVAQVTVGLKTMADGRVQPIRRSKFGFRTRAEALAHCPTLLVEKTGSKTVPDLLSYWKTYKTGELLKLSDSKQTAYEIAWKKLSSIQYRPVDTLTVADLRAVVAAKAPTHYPARDMKTLLSHLFRLAGADGFVNKDLPDFIILPDANERERTPFSAEEQAALWKVYDAGDRRAAVPLIMIYTGMMPGELQNLKLDMIDLDNQRITGVGLKTKVRRESPVYLPDAIIPVIASEMENSSSKSGYLLSRTTDKFYSDYYAVLEAAGCRRLEPYCCRHTTATALAITEGIAPQTVKKIMRWSTTRMLDRYAHPDDAAAREAINTLSRAPGDQPAVSPAPASAESAAPVPSEPTAGPGIT